MSEAQKIIQEFRESTHDYWSRRRTYNKVTALFLYWDQDDLDCAYEVDQLRDLFETYFNFSTTTFVIPCQRSVSKLSFTLSSFVEKHSPSSSLIIVYYGGHGTSDPETGKATWAAQSYGGPTLNWSDLQPILYGAEGDVLIILDCCHAALAMRGQKTGKIELLAASAQGVSTPAPGHLSYTDVLMRELRKLGNNDDNVSIVSLNTRLAIADSGLTETPIYFDISQNDEQSIILKPLLPTNTSRVPDKPVSYMLLGVSLLDNPAGDQIARWLKSYAPKSVSAVTIERLVLKATQLQNLSSSSPDQFRSGSLLGGLGEASKTQILDSLGDLERIVSDAARNSATGSSNLNEKYAERTIEGLEKWTSRVCDDVESGILLDPNFSSSQKLASVIEDEIADVAGVKEMVQLRQYLLGIAAIPDGLELPRGTVRYNEPSRPGKRFQSGHIEGKAVIVEFFAYQPNNQSGEPPAGLVSQLPKMAAQLCQPKRTSFHILPCVGYVHEKREKRFGLVFEIPDGHEAIQSPAMLFEQYKVINRVRLDYRVKLAHALAIALENFHRVGWVHKALKSENIYFLKVVEPGSGREGIEVKAPLSGFDFSNPSLFGFEYSRLEADETKLRPDFNPENNIYRHPQRWGRPAVKFLKAHDIYSLGVILLEIAFWKKAKAIARLTSRETIDPDEVGSRLSTSAKNDLPHLIGQDYSDAVVACFQFEELSTNFTEYEKHKLFREKVIEKLERMVGI